MRPHLASLVEDFRKYGSAAAIVNHRGNRRTVTTWAELAGIADRFAASIAAREIPLGERIVLWGQNSAEWMGAFFGCVLRGAIAVPLDAAGSLDFARRVIAETTPRLIVGDAELLNQIGDAIPKLAFEDFDATLPPAAGPTPINLSLNLDSPVQILFTSGTTSEPKGVVHTHRNVIASVAPIENEIPKFRKYLRIVKPLRILHTLPLSHVFGQFMALWIPPLIGAEIHFESRLEARRIMETSKRERISILAAVPRVVALLRDLLLADHPGLALDMDASRKLSVWKRWWHFRRIHHQFSYKFWAFVCGGASLPEDLETFWNTLGFAVIQGYGMTETTALIALNHPFHIGKGTIGKVLPGREVKIRDDGEVIVRGDMISTATWVNGKMQSADSPWLATGDLVSQDDEGRLRFVGRKSQVIVTPAGLNVHPEDVEAALNAQPGIEACAVVPLLTPHGTEPAAALLVRGSREEAEQAVIAANARLADFQRIRRWRIWPELDLPRTSTGKIRRGKVTEWMNAQHAEDSEINAGADPLLALILSLTGAHPTKTGEDARLAEDLQLDSLGRVQLQAELEQKLGLELSDVALEQAATLGELRRALGFESAAPKAASGGHAPTPIASAQVERARHEIYPRWTWNFFVRIIQIVFLECVMMPLTRLLGTPKVERESPLDTKTPLLLIANHISAYDVPLIQYALPLRMRHRMAVAAGADLLDNWLRRRGQKHWIINQVMPIAWLLVTGLFNTFPLPRNAGFHRSFEYMGEAMDHGYNVLVFPEGRLTEDGKLQPFRPGIGLLVKESQTRVLPVAMVGAGAMKMREQRWFRSGKLRISVGTPVSFPPEATPEEIAAQLHAKIERLLSEPEQS